MSPRDDLWDEQEWACVAPFFEEKNSADWFNAAALAKALDLMRWPTSVRSWSRAPARDVWATTYSGIPRPCLVTSDDQRAVIAIGGLPECFYAGLKLHAADVTRMIAWLGGRRGAYRHRGRRALRPATPEFQWDDHPSIHGSTATLDTWLASWHCYDYRAWHLGFRCEDITRARNAIAAGIAPGGPCMLDVLVHPWGHCELSLDGAAPTTLRPVHRECIPSVSPNWLSLHLRLPAHAFFGLFSGIYKGRGIAMLKCWSDAARPREAVLSVRRVFGFRNHAPWGEGTYATVHVTNVAMASAANGTDVAETHPWPEPGPTIIDEVYDALEGVQDGDAG